MSTGVNGNDYPELTGMRQYIGTKISGAKPMTRLEYNEFRGWKLPSNENGADEGYIVQYKGGYISWSPKAQFEEAYRPADGMNFGLAIEAMRQGMKVARKGWNGKGMFCILVPGTSDIKFNDGTPYHQALIELYGSEVANQTHEILPHIDMWTINADGRRAFLPGWLASQSDMLADDWMVVE